MDVKKISVYQIVGSSLCIEASDGDKISEQIKNVFSAGINVELSFLNVKMITSAFLNTAVGKLYKDFTDEEISSRLSVVDLCDDDMFLLNRVKENAVLYYKDIDKMEKSIKEVLGEE